MKAIAPAMGIHFLNPVRNTIFNSPWGQASIVSDSTTANYSLDSIRVYLSMNAGCTYDTIIDSFYNVAPNLAYSFLYRVPASTDKARLLAIGYKGANKVATLSDGEVQFNFPTTTGVDVAPPLRLALYANRPNPFNPETIIPFDIAATGHVRLRVVGVDGRLVRTLVDQVLPSGEYTVTWDGRTDRGSRAASGVFFSELTTQGKRLHRKMALLR